MTAAEYEHCERAALAHNHVKLGEPMHPRVANDVRELTKLLVEQRSEVERRWREKYDRLVAVAREAEQALGGEPLFPHESPRKELIEELARDDGAGGASGT